MLNQYRFSKIGDALISLTSRFPRPMAKHGFCFFRRFRLIVSVIFICLTIRPAVAQTMPDPQKMAAVMSVINMFLLDEDTSIELEQGEVTLGPIVVSNDLKILFEQQAEDQELCFVIEGNRGLTVTDISISINGVSISPVIFGENCFLLPVGQQQAENVLLLQIQGLGSATVSIISVDPAEPVYQGFEGLSRSSWDERAVRKVLQIFAFGGHATDHQIITWANMQPRAAIAEMLTFDEHNFKLSPIVGEKYIEHTQGPLSVDVIRRINNIDVVTPEVVRPGTLYGWQQYLRAPNTNYPVPLVIPNNGNPYYPRSQYGVDGNNFDDGYNRMITVRGLNPFRQRIGFWETNYHLAANLDAAVSGRQMAVYYDEIMDAHAAGLPYKDVMGVAAKSAALAMQYAHRNNRWNSSTGECECNDDFAREIHQLFYGIFGEHDPIPGDGIGGSEYHENTTIPNTAKMLTDMRVPYLNDVAIFGFTGFDIKVTFETNQHHVAPLTILGQTVSGSDASAKIDALMPISMQHPESLQNLPVMIVSVLANDNLTEANKTELRAAWAGMGVDRRLLDFIHGYSVSDQFHSATQFKYFTSHERALYIANKHNFENIEAFFGGAYYNGGRAGRTVGSVIQEDFAGEFFRPIHNVFGGQTSSEASDSSLVFENNYNRLTAEEDDIRNAVSCEQCDLGSPWLKKWEAVLPQRADGNYYVSDVAEWLWNHVVGSMDDYTELERAQLYSLLGAARDRPGADYDGIHALDFNLVMCVMADYAFNDQGFMSGNASITDILANSNKWDDYCRGSNGVYETHELDELNAQYTGAEIANSPEIQAILTELGNEIIPLNASGPSHANDGANLRRNTRARISSALGFIFTTPFVFAGGQ